MRRRLLQLALAATLCILPAAAQWVPTVLSYQGRLTDNTPQQNPIDGTLSMEFRIYSSATGSDQLWEENWPAVQVEDGVFSVLLGSQGAPLPPSVFTAGTSLFLEIVVLGEVLSPRQQLGSVPFSHVADRLGTFTGADLEESAEIDADIAVHDAASAAHANQFSLYYTKAQMDQVVDWNNWSIANVPAGDKFQFAHRNALQQMIPVMTLQPPAFGGNLGIGTTTPLERLEVAGAIKIGNTAAQNDGAIRFTGASFEGRTAEGWLTLGLDPGRANVKAFGAVGDGVHDDTQAVQLAIASFGNQGGVVFFPEGKYLITGQIVLPNDGGTPVRQQPIKFLGVGAYFEPRTENAVAPQFGSILDLRYAGGPKIATYGCGLFEAEGITFASFKLPPDGVPFIYTTNTTLHIHDCAFFGGLPGILPNNDAIVLGGTSANNPGGADPNGPFQGYGTVIRDNFFNRIRRAVYGRVFCNAVQFYANTIWTHCANPTGAAIEIDGDPDGVTPQGDAGWYVAGNLIEVTNYAWGIRAKKANRNAFVANGFFDPTPTTQACYRFESDAKVNYVLAGYHDDNWPFVDDQATGNSRSTVIDFHQDRESSYPQKARFTNKVYFEPGVDSPYGPRVVSPDGAELTYQFTGNNGLSLAYTPPGQASIPLWQVTDSGGGVITQDLKGTDSRIRSNGGQLRVQSKPGSALELCDTAGLGIKVNAGKIEFSSTAVQIMSGNGAPSGSAPSGTIYLRKDGGAGTTFYVREGNNWVAK